MISVPENRFEPVTNSRVFKRICESLNLGRMKVLDLGCAYGEHLVHFGQDSTGITTTLEEVEFGKKKNLRIEYGNAEALELAERFDAIWANNLFEHLASPHGFLVKLKKHSHSNALLILGVPVVPRIASLMKHSKFRGALAVAHINFFTKETLKLTVERAGWRVKEVRPYYLGNRWLDTVLGAFSPHLYVIAQNDVDFRYHEKKLKEWKDEPYYAELLEIVQKSSEGNLKEIKQT